ncbi:hypothetical protein [Azospirillum sp. B506]|uniref:hypothetical protein n=1 Tax=Azospirillum sp. B506 TaxID=137721 RepID=UPI0011DCF541|nr:hypothetical protein [Azospirillum sp. B506]
MASIKAFDLIKRLATDSEFRKRLGAEDHRGKQALLASEGFADVVHGDVRALQQSGVQRSPVASLTETIATGAKAVAVAAFGAPAKAAAAISGPAETAGISVPAIACAGFGTPAKAAAAISGPAETAGISVPAIACAGFSAPAFAAPAFCAPAFATRAVD